MTTSGQRIRSYSKVLAINSSLFLTLLRVMLIFITLMASLLILKSHSESDGSYGYFIAINLMFCAYGLTGIALIIPMFRELYDRQFADVEFSLPMSSSERITAKLLMLLKNHLLPFVIAGTGLTVFSTLVFKDRLGFTAMFGAFTSSLAFLVFVDCITVFCVTFCGRIYECIYSSVSYILMITLLPRYLTKAILHFSGKQALQGVVFGYDDILMNYQGHLRNFYGIEYDLPPLYMLLTRTVFNIALSMLVMYAAIKLYKKRNGTQTGTAVITTGFFISLAAGMACLSMVVGTVLCSLFVMVLSGFLGETILVLVLCNGNKDRRKMEIAYASFAAVFLLYFIIDVYLRY